MIMGTALPNSVKAISIRFRLRTRWPRGALPSLAVTAESTPLLLKVAWVRSKGLKRRRSNPLNQRLTKADLPTPLGPLKSRTLRRVAVCCRRAKARCPAGVSNQPSAESSPKGTAVAPHWRAKRDSSRLGAFFIGTAGLDLAVEMKVDWPGQAEAGPAVVDFDPIELVGIKAQLHLESAQAQVDFVKMVFNADRAVAADGAIHLVVEQLFQVQVWIQGSDQMSAALVTLVWSHACAGMHAGVIDALQPEGELGVELRQAGGTLARQTQSGFEVLLDRGENPLRFSF